MDQAALDQILSPFQRRVVGYDMDKSFWQKLESLSFDLLLLDFIDDRFDLMRTKDGGLFTLSNEYVSAAGQPPGAGASPAPARKSGGCGWPAGSGC